MSYNKRLSARIGSAVLRLDSFVRKLDETQKMLTDFVLEEHPDRRIPEEFKKELHRLQNVRDQVEAMATSLKVYNHTKTPVYPKKVEWFPDLP